MKYHENCNFQKWFRISREERVIGKNGSCIRTWDDVSVFAKFSNGIEKRPGKIMVGVTVSK